MQDLEVLSRGESEVRRIGIVEVGSRGVRLLVGTAEHGSFQAVARRYNSDVRLAEALAMREKALLERVEGIREVVDGYIRMCHDVGVDVTGVFGTESVRQLRRRSSAGFTLLTAKIGNFRVLQPKEEAYYALIAAYKSLPGVVADGETLLVVDQGAGSMQLAVGKASGPSIRMVAHRSYALGTEVLVSRLRELRGNLRKMPAWIAEHFGDRPLRGARSVRQVAVMGSAATKLAWISANPGPEERYTPRRVHGLRLPKWVLDRFIELSLQSRRTTQRLVDPRNPESGEMEAVVTGLMAIELVLERSGVSEFRVCGEAMRLGVAWALAMDTGWSLRRRPTCPPSSSVTSA